MLLGSVAFPDHTSHLRLVGIARWSMTEQRQAVSTCDHGYCLEVSGVQLQSYSVTQFPHLPKREGLQSGVCAYGNCNNREGFLAFQESWMSW